MPLNIYVAEIPVFKERKMTATSNDSGTFSYNVKDSYAGILRLSPNNTPSLLEQDNHTNLDDDLLNYVVFEDSVANILPNQFVRVSTSDGVMLDMRFGVDAVEYDNLYVLGAVKTPAVVTYGSLELGGNGLPYLHNSSGKVSSGPVTSVAITSENVEDTYIPVNTASDGEPSFFELKSATELIEPIINDILFSISTLPTGSIHWIPVNLEQYKALLDAGNIHNSSHIGNNTLIRDFLLCDGRTYNSKDYPELAKILLGEKVVRWKEEGEYMVPEEVISGVDTKYTFTVPDLRSMFIEYSVPFINKAKEVTNTTGYWEIDSCKDQEVIIHEKADKHYHHIVLDNPFNVGSSSNDMNGSNTITYSKAVKDPDTRITYGFTLGTEGPLAKYGSMGRGKNVTHCTSTVGHCRKCCWARVPNKRASMIYPQQTNISKYCSLASNTCGYILSGDYSENPSISIGLSSNANYSVILEPSNDDLNYTKLAAENNLKKFSQTMHDSIYNTPKKYVDYVQQISDDNGNTVFNDNLLSLRGKENTPEFFACLPLIKI